MLLLTAFEPFDGTGLNSSEQALQLFLKRHPRQIGLMPLASTILPVAFDEDVAAMRRFCAILPHPPRAILHLGQTAGAMVAIEERAVNLKPDASPIDKDAPPFFQSTFPSARIINALQQESIPCCASQDAGTYLCNHILFRSLQQAVIANSGAIVGFVHLPRLREQMTVETPEPTPTLPLQVLARAVEVAARTMAASWSN